MFILLLLFFVGGCGKKEDAMRNADSKEAAIILKIANGKVEVKVGSDFKDAVKGQTLVAGNIIKVGDEGLAVIEYPGKYEVFVDKNSQVSIKSIKPSAKKGFFGTVFHLFKGMIFSKVTIDTKQGDAYQVETDHVVAGVHGTEFLVEVNSENTETFVYVQEGIVKTRGRGKKGDDKEELIGKFQMTKVKQNSFPLPSSNYNPITPPFVTFWKKVENKDIKSKGKIHYKKK